MVSFVPPQYLLVTDNIRQLLRDKSSGVMRKT